jgi:hypothetical protein
MTEAGVPAESDEDRGARRCRWGTRVVWTGAVAVGLVGGEFVAQKWEERDLA